MNRRRWLLLIHQLPPKPDYLRVKVARRLGRIGAVAVKSTVYVLPHTDSAAEDFRWTIAEIMAAGGEATLCSARLLEGLDDEEVRELFRSAREADYAALMDEIRSVGASSARLQQELQRFRRRYDETRAIDFFHAPSGPSAAALLEELESYIQSGEPALEPVPTLAFSGRTWVTRVNVGFDGMASAWLIRRFIDRRARFRFVKGRPKPKKEEIRFAMLGAEFTNTAGRCTFEVLLDRAAIRERSLLAIAQVVHDIDLKVGRYRRPETAGIASVLAGIAQAHRKDQERIRRAAAVFDDLYTYYRKKRGLTRGEA